MKNSVRKKEVQGKRKNKASVGGPALENRRSQAPFFDGGAGIGQAHVIGVDLGEFHRDDVKLVDFCETSISLYNGFFYENFN